MRVIGWERPAIDARMDGKERIVRSRSTMMIAHLTRVICMAFAGIGWDIISVSAFMDISVSCLHKFCPAGLEMWAWPEPGVSFVFGGLDVAGKCSI